jgi:membrane protein
MRKLKIMRILGLRGLSPTFVIKRVWVDFSNDNMLTYAAAFAYQMLFALFPFLLFLFALFTLLDAASLFDWLLSQLDAAVPDEVMSQIEEAVEEARDRRGSLLSFSLLIFIWIASVGMRSAMKALNISYDVEETRPLWKRYLLSFLYTIGLAILVILATFLMFLGPQVTNWLGEQVGVEEYVLFLWRWLRIPVAALLAMMAVTLIYFMLPNVEHRFKIFSLGSVLTVLLWIAASIGFQYWVRNFAEYNLTYGSIGAVIMLLTYLYLIAVALLFGAELNSVILRHAPSPDDPKPQGPSAHRKDKESVKGEV